MNHDATSSQSSHHRSNKMIGSNPVTSKVEPGYLGGVNGCSAHCSSQMHCLLQTLNPSDPSSNQRLFKSEQFKIWKIHDHDQWSNQSWSSKPTFQNQIAFLKFNHPDDWWTWDSWDRKTVFNLHRAFVQCGYLQNAILYYTEWPRAIHWSSLCTRIHLSQCWSLALDSTPWSYCMQTERGCALWANSTTCKTKSCCNDQCWDLHFMIHDSWQVHDFDVFCWW